MRKNHTSLIGKYAPLDEQKENLKQFWALFQSPEIDQLHLVASFNSWLPVPMVLDSEQTQTKRTVPGEASAPGMRFRALDNFTQIATAVDPRDK